MEQAHNCSAGQEIPTFYGTRRFITVFTKAQYSTLSKFSWIHSTLSHPILYDSLCCYPSIYTQVFQMFSSLQAFQLKFRIYFWSTHACYIPCTYNFSWFCDPNIIWWWV